jgi:hypothetical protein
MSQLTHPDRALSLPPPYTLFPLRESGDAHAHACAIAAEEGAGSLVWTRRFDVAEFAVVLEPTEPLSLARRAFFAGMAALGDALAMHAPPEKPLSIDWPGTIRIDGGAVGGSRLAWPQGSDEKSPPDWLVFSAMIALAWPEGIDPGQHPGATTLREEGFEDVDSGRIIESFSRHLMSHIDSWTSKGFRLVMESYFERLPKARPSERRTLDPNGDLLVRANASARPEKWPLRPGIETPAWYDPETRMPRR